MSLCSKDSLPEVLLPPDSVYTTAYKFLIHDIILYWLYWNKLICYTSYIATWNYMFYMDPSPTEHAVYIKRLDTQSKDSHA